MPFIQFIKTLLTQVNDVFAEGFQQKLTLIRNFLSDTNENATIRMFVPASSGVGHQATCVNILHRLAALGFQQTVQVIYDNEAGETGNKLKRLIPGFDPATNAPVVLNGVTLNFFTVQYFNDNPGDFAELGFGITGGYDNERVNMADKMNVTFFLLLQPFEWTKKNMVQRKGADKTTWPVLEAQPALGNLSFRRRGYYLAPPQLNQQDLVDLATTFPGKRQPYEDILAVTTGNAPTVNLMPVYGVGDTASPGIVEADFNLKPESIMLNLILAVADRQRNSNIQRLRRSAIIVIIATVTAGPYQNLDGFLSGNANNLVALNGYVNQQQIPQRVTVMDYNDQGLQQAITALTNINDHILVVKMSSLTIATFNYMYARSSLPCVFEGKGTVNMVLNLGIPYLNIMKSSTHYPTLPLTAAMQSPISAQADTNARGMNTTAVVLDGALAGQAAANSITLVAAQIEDSYDNQHQMYQYFTSLGAFFHDEKEDKLILSLLFFLGYVNTQN